MEKYHCSSAIELIEAQAQIWCISFVRITKHCLQCALELGIPQLLHRRRGGGPTSLPALLSALHLRPSKRDALRRLMRLLVNAGFFRLEEAAAEEYDNYLLTPASELLIIGQQGANPEEIIINKPPPLPGHLFLRIDPDPLGVLSSLSAWFRSSDDRPTTAFEAVHGKPMWESMSSEDGTAAAMRQRFYDVMAGDSELVARVVVSDYCNEVFRGVGSLVDVGGGTGIMAAAIAKAFPDIKCTVFDLPHVDYVPVEGLANLTFVGGSVFDDEIPSAHAILLKWVLHNWDDENCVKILTRCKEAVSSYGGKVILIDMVVGNNDVDKELLQVQLCFDLMMMSLLNGKERTEAEFEKLFVAAGFSSYKIVRALGPRSIIEVYP